MAAIGYECSRRWAPLPISPALPDRINVQVLPAFDPFQGMLIRSVTNNLFSPDIPVPWLAASRRGRKYGDE
jgi:hypothetical protein